MNKLGNRLVIALIALLASSFVAVALSRDLTQQVRSAVRLHAADQAQIQGYFELHSHLREFESEFRRILASTEQTMTLDFRAYRDQIDRLLLALRADIEREHIERGGHKNSVPLADPDGAGDRERLLSLANEIQSMLAGAEIAAALFRAGRKAEGLKLLEEALDDRIDNNLDVIIDQAVAADKAQARAITDAILTRLDREEKSGTIFFAVFLVILVIILLVVLVPFVRSMTALREISDKLALGGDLESPANGECLEFVAVYDGLKRAAQTQARLREERDTCEAEFGKRTDAMRQIDQVRRDFLADVSHELRTPLTVLRGVAEVALRTQASDPRELKTVLSHIVDESRHVTRIVDDLFFIARSHAGALDLRTDIVDFTAVSQAAEREAQGLASRSQGRITWRSLPKSVEVEGDEDRLRQLFTILIDNALKYGGRNPSVEVEQKLADKMIVIDIRDHGPGVPEKDLPHVFERLYRGAVPVMAEPQGSGLGLPLAKSIVEGHGGSISLSNAEGGGAVARISLPIFDSNALEITTQ